MSKSLKTVMRRTRGNLEWSFLRTLKVKVDRRTQARKVDMMFCNHVNYEQSSEIRMLLRTTAYKNAPPNSQLSASFESQFCPFPSIYRKRYDKSHLSGDSQTSLIVPPSRLIMSFSARSRPHLCIHIVMRLGIVNEQPARVHPDRSLSMQRTRTGRNRKFELDRQDHRRIPVVPSQAICMLFRQVLQDAPRYIQEHCERTGSYLLIVVFQLDPGSPHQSASTDGVAICSYRA